LITHIINSMNLVVFENTTKRTPLVGISKLSFKSFAYLQPFHGCIKSPIDT
jgi:hypothetical protein